MPCNLCKMLPQHIRSDKRHERLQQVGLTERISRAGKSKAAWVTYYVCEICETKWQHVDDPSNTSAGWSVQKQFVFSEHHDGLPQARSAARPS